MTDEKEFIWVTHQKGSIKYYSEAAYVKLQNEVERLKNTYEPVEGPPMTPEEDASFMAKIDDIFKSPDVQEILKEINERRKQKEERNRKADAYDDLQAKLQSAEAEIDRQISLRKASESVDEEYRAKLEAAERELKAESAMRTMDIKLLNQAVIDARRLAEALEKVLVQDGYVIDEASEIAREALTPEIRERYLK